MIVNIFMGYPLISLNISRPQETGGRRRREI